MDKAEVAFSSYIVAISSAIFGLIGFALYISQSSITDDPFVSSLFIGILPWSILLTAGSILVIIGLKKQKLRLLKWGAALAFAMWIFAGVSFGVTLNVVTLLVVVIPDLIYFGYVFLAAALRHADGKRSVPKKAVPRRP